jgi:hypothetical protein
MPQLPAPESEDIALVLIGALNPAIFHPEWFVRHDLLSEGEVREAEVKVISPQVCDLTFHDFGFQALQNRLTVRTVDVSKAPKLIDLIQGVLTKLPHTPINAVGINQSIHVATGGEENWHKIGNSLAPKKPVWGDIYEKPGMLSITIQSPRSGPISSYVNITVQLSAIVPHGLFVASNVEFKPTKPIGSAVEVVNFIKTEWHSAIKEATRAAEYIFRKIIWEL